MPEACVFSSILNPRMPRPFPDDLPRLPVGVASHPAPSCCRSLYPALLRACSPFSELRGRPVPLCLAGEVAGVRQSVCSCPEGARGLPGGLQGAPLPAPRHVRESNGGAQDCPEQSVRHPPHGHRGSGCGEIEVLHQPCVCDLVASSASRLKSATLIALWPEACAFSLHPESVIAPPVSGRPTSPACWSCQSPRTILLSMELVT